MLSACHCETLRYEWTKNGDELNIDGSSIKYAGPSSGTIELSGPTEADEGFYQCLASNAFGTAVSIKTSLRQAG